MGKKKTFLKCFWKNKIHYSRKKKISLVTINNGLEICSDDSEQD